MTASDGIGRRSEIANRLISLVDKENLAPDAPDSIYQMVNDDFEAFLFARSKKKKWKEIAETCGFPGKENRFRDAFTNERRRRAKQEKEVVQEKKGGMKASTKTGSDFSKNPGRSNEKLKIKNELKTATNNGWEEITY